MTGLRILLLVLVGCCCAVLPASAAEPARSVFSPQAIEFFETRVRPVLAEHCYSCHGPKRQQAGLRLDSREAVLKGGDAGPIVVPGRPDQGNLLRALSHQGEVKMPPKGRLPDAAVDALRAWVQQGLPWPTEVARSATTAVTRPLDHWAFRPVRPPVRPGDVIDGPIAATLAARGLRPSPEAARRTLIRRVTFDLTGLPPTFAEVEAFAADPTPDAYERLVDRLLASPRHGERWARHWLDLARYADTKGYVFQEERRYPYAYTYRDYVIRAFNEDLPYDRFLIEQLAADRLPLGDDKRPLAAMGFLTLGRRFLNNTHDIIDDRLDVTVRGLQGLTIGCARCHDHKFDPIPMRDYYALYGVFAGSVEAKDPPLLAAPERTLAYVAFEKELQKREKDVADFREKHKSELASGNRKFRDEVRKLQNQVDAWKATSPAAPARPMMLEDARTPYNPRVFLRGNPGNPGEMVPRQYLEVVAGPKRKPFTDGSGRLELARAIASRDNPLTARVLVNRVWLHYFGTGLVGTPSDFGLRSDPPTHPEVLDGLAWRFMEGGWSLKGLHRAIVLSRTYRQASADHEDGRRLDPENRLVWRMNRRRLDLEALRDALLTAGGGVDATMGGASVELTKAPFSRRRTVYGFIDRQNLPGLYRTFDFASPDTHSPLRHETTVPQQALFLMNSPFLVDQVQRLAVRSEGEAGPEQRVERLYRLVYGRQPEAEERALGVRFVEAAGGGATAWERYGQVLLLANEFAFVD